MKGFILHSFYWKFFKKKENSNNSVVQNYKFVYFPLLKKKNYSNKLRYIEVKEYNTSSIYGVLI